MNASASFYLYIPTQMRIKIYQTKNKHPNHFFKKKKCILQAIFQFFLHLRRKREYKPLKTKDYDEEKPLYDAAGRFPDRMLER